MSTTPLPTDPTARLNLYVSRLTAVPEAQRTAKQSAELVTYAGRLAAMSTPATLTPSQQAAVQAFDQVDIAKAIERQQTAAIQAMVASGQLQPGQAAPANWGAISGQLYGQAVDAVTRQALGPNAVKGSPSGATTPLVQSNPAPATSTGGGIATPTAAGSAPLPNAASPYVPSIDMSGASSAGGGGGGGLPGLSDMSGSSTGGVSPLLLLGVGAAALYLMLGRKGKRRK